jgi:hypothetical protein
LIRPRVLLADDYPLLREAIVGLLKPQFDVVGTATDTVNFWTCVSIVSNIDLLSLFLGLLLHLLHLSLHHHLLLLFGSLGEKESNLKPHAPGRSSRGMNTVSVKLRGETYWLGAGLHDSFGWCMLESPTLGSA